MDKAIFIAMSGAKQTMLAQQAHANNLANVKTTGFKEDFTQARSMPVYGEYYPTRAYAMTERPGTNFDSGPLIQTGNNLDVAIKGDGWIAVQAEDGSEAYTRAGDFNIDINGQLRTGKGLPVLGDGGPIVLPPSAKIEIGADGTISVLPLGAQVVGLAIVDRIRLVNPDAADLEKSEDGLVHLKEGVAPPIPDGAIQVAPGFLEGSNVNAVSALTDILSLSRQYELQVKLMSQADEMSQSTARLLQFS
tara:strand:+ start:7195 stop:7938 length:744 start_codon:yes stop_codon:yes gene_type:complete